eukprot:scaffold47081_cov64-Phaeocystis_antarctica.AAC.4
MELRTSVTATWAMRLGEASNYKFWCRRLEPWADPIGFRGLFIPFWGIGRAGGKPVESLNTSKM